MIKVRLALVAALVLIVSGVVQAAPAPGAAVDPERTLSLPVGTIFAKDRTASRIEELRAQGFRLTDIEVQGTNPYRFGAVFVRNTGPYTRTADWGNAMTGRELNAYIRGGNWRLIDLEPYRVDGTRRYAFAAVRNVESARKVGWSWAANRTRAQIHDAVGKEGLRLIDVDSYLVNGERRYSYVAVRNRGVDRTGWRLIYAASPAFVQQQLEAGGYRLVDIERVENGKLAALMIRNPSGTFSLHSDDLTWTQLLRLTASNAVRIVDLDRYGDTWSAVMIDNAGPESARLRSIVRQSPYVNGFFGVFAKRVGGPVHVGLAHNYPYQPASVIKLASHLYTMDLLDKGQIDLDGDVVNWVSPYGRPEFILCGDDESKDFVKATLRATLELSLQKSDNAAHEALLNLYGADSITARMHQLGLERTEVYSSCPEAGQRDWQWNRTTLAEMGELFEGVDLGRFFPFRGSSTRETFYGLVKDWDESSFRPVVEEEARPLGIGPAEVEEFLSLIQYDAKPGNIDLSGERAGSWMVWRAFSYRVAFPVKRLVTIRSFPSLVTNLRTYVGGFFVHGLEAPCAQLASPSENAGIEGCLKYSGEMDAIFYKLPAESQRTAIREALTTWTIGR
jgi:hypothetical protein